MTVVVTQRRGVDAAGGSGVHALELFRTVQHVSDLRPSTQIGGAEDGNAGVNALKSGDNPIAVDAIICDLDMPKMGGIEAIPNFLFRFPTCPIIILSGSEKLESASRLFQPGVLFKQGVREFLSKPIDQGRLVGAVEKVINEGGRKDTSAT